MSGAATSAKTTLSWEYLLAQCIDSIDSDNFHGQLIDALKSLTDFDNSVVFAYHSKQHPLCLDHTFAEYNRAVFVDDYLQGPFLLDPFYQACKRKIATGLYRLGDIAPDRFLQSEYYRSYYVSTDIKEEICYIFYLSTDTAIVISLMRGEKSSRFSARQFKLLDKVTPIVISMAKRHWQAISATGNSDTTDSTSQEDQSRIEKAVSEYFGQRITPREIQVVAQVFEGHSSEAISKNLGISVGTVRIHRRNIYAKLQVSSQQELFANFFKKMTSSAK